MEAAIPNLLKLVERCGFIRVADGAAQQLVHWRPCSRSRSRLFLHTSKAGLRDELLACAPRFAPQNLVDVGESYARASGCPSQYQWVIFGGVNNGADEVESIARLRAGKYPLMNIILHNADAEVPRRRPAAERAAEMARALRSSCVRTKLRQSAGQDVNAGCGQLRERQLSGVTPALQPVRWRA